MLMLALELSTRRGSVALANVGPPFRLLDEVEWDAPQARSEHVFAALQELLNRRGLKIAEIQVFALGRGPGGFSGIRMAVTAAQALALPAERRVVAVSSGAALVHGLREAHPHRVIAIVGDARRDTWWWGVFPAAGSLRQDWQASTPTQVLAGLPAEALVASPDWDRLAARVGEDPRWLRAACVPRARQVAALAAERLQSGATGEPLEPIYLHPAV
jgi:tRNA threonylcarbamoyladenosine biosynthesis protein TsaB